MHGEMQIKNSMQQSASQYKNKKQKMIAIKCLFLPPLLNGNESQVYQKKHERKLKAVEMGCLYVVTYTLNIKYMKTIQRDYI